MTGQALNLYAILKSTLNEDSAKAIVEYLNEEIKINTAQHSSMEIENLVTKEDLRNSELRLATSISDSTIDLMKWMFFFFLWQTVLLTAVLIFID
jgi:hypothetical protein